MEVLKVWVLRHLASVFEDRQGYKMENVVSRLAPGCPQSSSKSRARKAPLSPFATVCALDRWCPLWVKSGRSALLRPVSFLPQIAVVHRRSTEFQSSDG